MGTALFAQKEDLFKLKLKMFEQPQVEKSKSKNHQKRKEIR